MSKVPRRIIARTVVDKLIAEPTQRKRWLQITAAYLLEHKMADDVELVINEIAREYYERTGHLYTEVTSARKLNDGVRTDLARVLSDATDAKHVELSEKVDHALIGGLVARTPNAELDVSLRTKLKQLASI